MLTRCFNDSLSYKVHTSESPAFLIITPCSGMHNVIGHVNASSVALRDDELTLNEHFSICSNTNSVCITEGRGGEAYGLGILAKIWRPDSPPLRSRSRRLTLFNAVRKALSDK